ncbi:MAG: c-type cytochrome [Xanthobacteraceae bacterium]|nr:c-type cytochrome [Xanthobacteraceae bacterium]MBX3533821.1 c-type cytochrome [Xanthobacteraceae bacterium]MBX3549348.1 c-type cytochrome [Xanthobacteraceae bacterium]MCW5673571.1 c-type cytochrome [Xanthobacteraceae bacterium]MCW5678927.1 c-type cytochrome [Xanthobacteraceae bacterium]
MDSFELNKVMGAILGTLLFTLALNIVSGGIFASHAPHKAGYEIVAKDDKGGQQQAAVEPQIPLENLLNEANPEKGASIARQCVACHDFTKGGPNKVGPNLYGVVNRDSASHEGFNYSNAMKAKKAKWTFEAIDKFLENPSKVVPGTSMTFLGLRKATDRAAVIAYLNKQADAPAPLPKPVAVNATPDAQKKDGDKKDAEKKDAPKQKDAEKKDAPAPAEKKEMPAEKKDAPAPAEKKDAPAKQ